MSRKFSVQASLGEISVDISQLLTVSFCAHRSQPRAGRGSQGKCEAKGCTSAKLTPAKRANQQVANVLSFSTWTVTDPCRGLRASQTVTNVHSFLYSTAPIPAEGVIFLGCTLRHFLFLRILLHLFWHSALFGCASGGTQRPTCTTHNE